MALMTITKLRKLLMRRQETMEGLKHLSPMKNYTDAEYNYLILFVKIIYKIIALYSAEIEQGVTASRFEITYSLTLTNW
jgi:hypothetical protein